MLTLSTCRCVADMNEPPIFGAQLVDVDVAERALPGSWPADVFDIIPPVDPEGSTNFVYSVVSGDINHVFGVGGSFAHGELPNGNTNVLVTRPPGPLLEYDYYDLVIGATDDGVPPATGVFVLNVTVQNTRVLQPTVNFTCYLDNPCTVCGSWLCGSHMQTYTRMHTFCTV